MSVVDVHAPPSVTLLLASRVHSADQISSLLQISPDRSWRIGDRSRPGAAPKETHGWVLGSKAPDSSSLEMHLDSVLQQVSHVERQLQAIARDSEATILCSAYADKPLLLDMPPFIFQKLDRLEIALGLDIYAVNDDAGRDTANVETFQKTRAFFVMISGLPGEPSQLGTWFARPRRLATAFRSRFWKWRQELEGPGVSDDADLETHIEELLRRLSWKDSYDGLRELRVWCSVLTNTRLVAGLDASVISRFARLRTGLTVDYYLTASLPAETVQR